MGRPLFKLVGLFHCGWHNSTYTATRYPACQFSTGPQNTGTRQEEGAETVVLASGKAPSASVDSTLEPVRSLTIYFPPLLLPSSHRHLPSYSYFSHQHSVPSSSEITPSLLPLEPKTREVAPWPGHTQRVHCGDLPPSIRRFCSPTHRAVGLLLSGCCLVLGQ